MNRADTITTTTIDRWLMPHIAGILRYAEADQTFALTLATWLDEENWSITPVPQLNPSSHLVPKDNEHADDVIDWLMHELATHPEARVARSLLVTWASDYVAPQNLMIGIEGLVLEGFPVGLTKKQQRLSQLQIVLEENWQADQSLPELHEATHTLSQLLIATELRKAGGKLGSLHPDTAEWCMGGSRTKLYTCNTKELNKLHKTVTKHGLHHRTLKTDSKLRAVAISPSVSDGLVEETILTTK